MNGFCNKNALPKKILAYVGLLELCLLDLIENNTFILFCHSSIQSESWEALCQSPHFADENTEGRESSSFVQSQQLASIRINHDSIA